mmetsp:Transcript_21634/g.66223  ORF Transcript_21634/g.66223 Transcript_21634/m.66223 type:complete len:176 (+) Transcript_21634:597-1124(+)
MDRGRRAMPVGNKACHERYIKKMQENHKRKLRNMKCSIDNKPPTTQRHLKRNAKKEALLEERYASIERENRLLLEKMSYIMKRNESTRMQGAATVAVGANSTSMRAQRAQGHTSLNRESRKRQLQKITNENKAILRRIQNAQPYYDHVQWLEQARRNEEYMRNICEFDPVEGMQF